MPNLLPIALLSLLPFQPLVAGPPVAARDFGEIVGRVLVEEGGHQGPAARARIAVTCRASKAKYAFSDQRGIFRLSDSSVNGACELRVRYKGLISNAISVIVAGRANATLLLTPAGDHWRLSRRRGG